ncbi:hypothetical protein [Aeromonas sp. ASNIH1]|uniref:hypothetical protein n=1 Tax=Aeromonas sp. ASNIH1 TaxID=1636606 RepID=UPI000CDCA266|nr:hypothetical protein [Aeromonas sp. ASNIH1]AUZ81337.1 hypothetical protein C2U37_18060 [Aeromonas sp. ASNIH1]
MAGIWYRAGTVSVTNGSKKITGFGTLWKTTALKPDKGHPVHGPDGRIYELDYVESDTVMYIVTAYAGATAAGQAYAIDIPRTSSIPAFSRDLAEFMGYHQTQMDGWQKVLTGTGMVTLTAPDGQQVQVPALSAFQPTSASLKALQALTPAADKLPVFSSSTAAKLIDLPAFSQSFLSKATTAALARAELEAKQQEVFLSFPLSLNWCKIATVTIPQARTEIIELFGNAGYDATSNKWAQKVEIIIRGLNGSPKSISVIARNPGKQNAILSAICFTNPGGGDVYDIYAIPGNIYTQNILARCSPGVELSLVNTGSTETPANSTPGLIYTQFDSKNAVGTVSQDNGLPTGAIVETGENANGMYIKFLGGLMVCFCNLSVSSFAVTAAVGGIFQSAATVTVNYPATFVGAVRSFAEALYGSGGNRPWPVLTTQGTSYSSYVFQSGLSMASFNGNLLVGVMGRWH